MASSRAVNAGTSTPAGNCCHFVLLEKDESCPTADLSNIGRPNGPVYLTGEQLNTPQILTSFCSAWQKRGMTVAKWCRVRCFLRVDKIDPGRHRRQSARPVRHAGDNVQGSDGRQDSVRDRRVPGVRTHERAYVRDTAIAQGARPRSEGTAFAPLTRLLIKDADLLRMNPREWPTYRFCKVITVV